MRQITRLVHPTGVLKIGEHVEVPEVPEIKIPPPHFVPTPSVKENRHPIYGIGKDNYFPSCVTICLVGR